MKKEKQTTVGELIVALSDLPEDATVMEAKAGYHGPLDREEYGHTLKVYRNGDDIRLYIDDGQAWHADLEPHWEPLL